MKKYKTDDLEIYVVIHNDCGNGTKKYFEIGMTNIGEPLEEPQISFYVPTDLCKAQFNDANFVKHILNYFIKE